MKQLLIACAGALSLTLSMTAPVSAAVLNPISYDMPNGDGQASGGTFNYWDATYSGAGLVTTDGAPLSGGLGKLTDGVVATQPWYLVSDVSGTGQYVGWLAPMTADPVITFHFAGTAMISDIQIQMDNSGIGGGFAPGAILINGVNTPFTAPALGSVGVVDFSGLNLTGNTVTLQFNQLPDTWTFVSEVSFNGVAGVPEPGAWAMMLVGLGGAGAVLRRARCKAGNAAFAA